MLLHQRTLSWDVKASCNESVCDDNMSLGDGLCGELITYFRCKWPVVESADNQGPVGDIQFPHLGHYVHLLLWRQRLIRQNLQEGLSARSKSPENTCRFVSGIHICLSIDLRDGVFQRRAFTDEESAKAIVPLVKEA